MEYSDNRLLRQLVRSWLCGVDSISYLDILDIPDTSRGLNRSPCNEAHAEHCFAFGHSG